MAQRKRSKEPTPQTAPPSEEQVAIFQEVKNDPLRMVEQFHYVKKKTPKTNKKGSKRIGYERRAEHIRFVIDCAAAFYKVVDIVEALKVKYGEDSEFCLAPQTVNTIIHRYADEVLVRRQMLTEAVPITNPASRLIYLQQILDEAAVGTPKISKTGQVIFVKDFNAAISVIKYMEQIQKGADVETQAIQESAKIKEQADVILNLIEKIAATEPNKTRTEIFDSISKRFKDNPEALELVEEMITQEENALVH